MSHHDRTEGWYSPSQREQRQREEAARSHCDEESREARRAERVRKVTDFLTGRAALKRVTNMREVSQATGIPRHKLGPVLCQVAKNTWETDGVLLPAVIVHFNDNRPGHRFAAWAKAAGLLDAGQNPNAVHETQLEAVFAKYSSCAPSSTCESGSSSRWSRPGTRARAW